MYATITQEMVSSGDWVTLRFDGVRYFEKPPLWFWLTALGYSILGPSEFTTRLWSALPALGLVLVTYLLGRRLIGDQGGFYAALILASNFLLPLSARRASTDLLFSFFLALALYGFVLCAQEAKGFLQGPLFFSLGIGLAVLAKGLTGLLFPLLIVGLYVLVTGESAPLGRLRPSLGIPLVLLIVLPWHLMAAFRNEGFLWYYLMENHVHRFLGNRIVPHDDIPASTMGFLAVTALWFFPWSVLLPPAFVGFIGRVRGLFRDQKRDLSSGARVAFSGYPRVAGEGDPSWSDEIKALDGIRTDERLWLLVPLWVLVIFGVFAVSGFKHEYYSLPAFPALSLMVGGLWAGGLGLSSGPPGQPPKAALTRTTLWLALSFAGAALYLVLLFLWKGAFTTEHVLAGLAGVNVSFRVLLKQGINLPADFGPQVFSLLALCELFALVGFGVAWLLSWLRHPGLSFGILVVMGVAIGLLILPFFHLLEPHYSVKAVSSALVAQVGPEDLIVHEGRLERGGGLRFYTGHQVYIVNGWEGSLRFGSGYPEARHLFLGTAEFVHLWEGPSRVFLVTNFPLERSIRRFLKSQTVHELGLYGSRWLFSNRE
ncbi:MAG: glycosyltransferase family 39 protein [candidate division NC10 bacterium]|nr:glycosyltransferase family 39 protein [candidate division NC10 bacterium]